MNQQDTCCEKCHIVIDRDDVCDDTNCLCHNVANHTDIESVATKIAEAVKAERERMQQVLLELHDKAETSKDRVFIMSVIGVINRVTK